MLALIQIHYRLNTYVALLIAGLVLVAVLAIEELEAGRLRRLASGALVLAMSVTIGLCAWQLFVPDTHQSEVVYEDLREVFASPNIAPRTWYSNEAYLDASAPIASVAPDRILAIDPAGLDGNETTLTLQPPPGPEPFAKTMGAGRAIVDMDGLERVGRTSNGFTVARRPDGGSGPVQVTLSAAGGATIAGRILSLLALAALAAAAGLRRRRRPPSE